MIGYIILQSKEIERGFFLEDYRIGNRIYFSGFFFFFFFFDESGKKPVGNAKKRGKKGKGRKNESGAAGQCRGLTWKSGKALHAASQA